jgi:hypothetical protein
VRKSQLEVAETFKYNRLKAVAYANQWWDKRAPQYPDMGVDCTNFVSQCLYAGGAPMKYTGIRSTGWWCRTGMAGEPWSYSWAVANAFRTFLLHAEQGVRAVEIREPGQLKLGDVICYDWDGDGRYTHNTIVTAYDDSGAPLVNAHTNDSVHRNWAYLDSHAWTTRTNYMFLTIKDDFGG